MRVVGLSPLLICFELVAVAAASVMTAVGLGGYLPVFVLFDVLLVAPACALVCGAVAYGSTGYGGNERR